MKKTLSLLLCFVMIFAVMVPAFADGSAAASVSASSSSVKRGDTVEVTVSVKGTAEAKSLMVSPSYDSKVLELTGKTFIVSGAALSDFKGADGVLAFAEARTMNFAVAKYTFKVKSDAAYGSTTVSASITIQNPSVSCSPASASITVVCAHSNTTRTAAKAATCTADGNIEYWTCSDCGGVFSDSACKKAVSSVKVDKLGHNYADKSNSTQHWQQCTRCGDKKDAASHSFDQKDTSAKYLKSAADCKGPAVYYYSCTCGAKGTDTFTDGSKGSHDFSKKAATDKYLKSAATCTEPAVYFYSCSVCGEKGTKTFEGKANGHDFGAWKEDGDGHVRVCAVCGTKETAQHRWDRGVVTKQPTTTETGEKKFTCLDCGVTKLETLDKFEESDLEIKELTLTDNGVTVSGKMAAGAVLMAEDLDKSDELYEAAVKAVCAAFDLSADKVLTVYDVRLLVNDVEVQPDGSVTVKLELPAELVGKGFDLYSVATDADGKSDTAQIMYVASGGGNTVEFKLDKMGQLVFVDNTEPEPVESPEPTTAPEETEDTDSGNAWIYILIAAAAVVIIVVVVKKKKK